MHCVASVQPFWLTALFTVSVLLGLVAITLIVLAFRALAQDRKRRALRRQAWHLTRLLLNPAGSNGKVVIRNGRIMQWSCTVNRPHGAAECNGYHLDNSDT